MAGEFVFRWASYRRDALERIAWTAAAAAAGAVSVQALGLPDWAVIPATALLTTLKVVIAKHVGDPTTAAIIPGE